ncbi:MULTISPECIES: hypothetical protein [unclassified Serratia (in: enterobacteria)]|uniref:hypothetical protein n=1 Tax=unclassified Serratia (in: enterobacteria) TaxID=2647522 RepID=UPI000469EA38|nr:MULTISPECIES: hypothetical protein [unclassified Serratia (in: enterobacteria)]
MSEVNISEAVTSPVVAHELKESSVFALRSSEFKARLERHQQLERAQEIRDSLLQVARRIEAPAKKLEQSLTSYLLLRQVRDSESGEPIVGMFDREIFGHPQTLLTAFQQQYATHKHDVAQVQEFALLVLEIERLAGGLSDHTSAAWRNYTRTLKAQWEVDQRLFINLAHQEGQRKVQQHYSDLVAQFTNISRGLPKTADEVEAVLAVHEKLCQQRDALNLDVPEEVKLFLKAVAGQGATLDMLTSNVCNWLAKEDDPTRYRIKRL